MHFSFSTFKGLVRAVDNTWLLLVLRELRSWASLMMKLNSCCCCCHVALSAQPVDTIPLSISNSFRTIFGLFDRNLAERLVIDSRWS